MYFLSNTCAQLYIAHTESCFHIIQIWKPELSSKPRSLRKKLREQSGSLATHTRLQWTHVHDEYTVQQLPALTTQWPGSSQDNRSLFSMDRLVGDKWGAAEAILRVCLPTSSKLKTAVTGSGGSETLWSVPPASMGTSKGLVGSSSRTGRGHEKEKQKWSSCLAAHTAGSQWPSIPQALTLRNRNQNRFLDATNNVIYT